MVLYFQPLGFLAQLGVCLLHCCDPARRRLLHRSRPAADQAQARETLKRVAACEPMREIAFLRVDHSTIPRLKARSAAEV